jgi:hypothetical protein
MSLLGRAPARVVSATERQPAARTTEARAETDRFAEAFKASRGKIDPDLDLEA